MPDIETTESDVQEKHKRSPRSPWRCLRRIAIALLLLVGLLLLASNTLANRLVDITDDNELRHGDTDIMAGAEERILGSENASMAVLAVPGFLGGSNNFADLPDRLAEQGCFVQVLRLPGHGTSPRDLEKTTEKELLAAVEEALMPLRKRYDKVILMGHSMGGALCTLAASRNQVDGLVLGAPYFGVTHRWYYGLRPETWSKLMAPAMRWVYKGRIFVRVNKPGVRNEIVSYDWVPMRSVVMLQQLGNRVNTPEVLANVTCPVLWIHSAIDEAASYQAASRAFEHLAASDKRHVRLKTSDHIIFWDYEREEVAMKVEAFIGEMAKRGKDKGN